MASLHTRFENGSGGSDGIQQRPRLVGDGSSSLTEAIAWLEGLQAALDCYNWVLVEQYVSLSELFPGVCMWAYMYVCVYASNNHCSSHL